MPPLNHLDFGVHSNSMHPLHLRAVFLFSFYCYLCHSSTARDLSCGSFSLNFRSTSNFNRRPAWVRVRFSSSSPSLSFSSIFPFQFHNSPQLSVCECVFNKSNTRQNHFSLCTPLFQLFTSTSSTLIIFWVDHTPPLFFVFSYLLIVDSL